jgi:alkanesulfonate monooxygenase SsuD/methylene tetrahydromethanopterin reductase-like flavin-dependent oxidoreductase (luciferase family)
MRCEFGIFDHLDRGGRDLSDIYGERLCMLRAYDDAGFYAYHLAEHHGTTLGMAPSPGIFLAAAAQHTKRLRLGPMLYVLPLHDPVRLIEEICMLDQLSGGRLELGMGKGFSPFEAAFFGVSHLEAASVYNEARAIILTGLQCEVLSHQGDHYRYRDVPMVLKPRQRPHPPLWEGIASPASAAGAANAGANIITNGPAGRVRLLIAAYKSAAAETGRNDSAIKLGVTRHVHVAESDDAAIGAATQAYRVWYDSNAELWRRYQTESLIFPRTLDEALASGVALVGSPATVRSKLEETIETSGINYLLGRFAFGDLSTERVLGSIALFTSKIMPAFR